MVVERADLVDRHGLAETGLLEHPGEVLAVLTAAGERAVGACREGQQRRVAVAGRLAHRVGEVGRPVAVAPVHRQVDAAACELRLQRGLEGAVLRVDRAHPAEVPVVVRDLLQALIRDPSAAGDVAQERDHVVLPLGSAESCEQDPVVGDGVSTNSGPLAAGAEAKGTVAAVTFRALTLPSSPEVPLPPPSALTATPFAAVTRETVRDALWRRLGGLPPAPAARILRPKPSPLGV